MLFLADMKCLSSREKSNINPHAVDTALESIIVYKQGTGMYGIKMHAHMIVTLAQLY